MQQAPAFSAAPRGQSQSGWKAVADRMPCRRADGNAGGELGKSQAPSRRSAGTEAPKYLAKVLSAGGQHCESVKSMAGNLLQGFCQAFAKPMGLCAVRKMVQSVKLFL